MWANTEIVRLFEWMRTHNSTVTSEENVGFYGLDVYSLFESIEVVLKQLEKVNPFLARRARAQYDCFQSFHRDERAYIKFMGETSLSCQNEVVSVLQDLLQLKLSGMRDPDEMLFDARQNARVIVNAERYYRTMIHGNEDSWNVRDRHMLESLEHLLDRHGPQSKAIVWAHNSHIGDYRATDMLKQGLVNLGGLAREKWGEEQVALLGFGTNEGKVIASRAWDGPIEVMSVQSGKPGTYESLLHEVSKVIGQNCYSISFRKNRELRRIFSQVRGHRAIGVVYHPQYEHFGNYVPTAFSYRYDAFLFLDQTSALEPLVQDFEREEIPETWPLGQ
jgi:erythromycin esterase-like protein